MLTKKVGIILLYFIILKMKLLQIRTKGFIILIGIVRYCGEKGIMEGNNDCF